MVQTTGPDVVSPRPRVLVLKASYRGHGNSNRRATFFSTNKCSAVRQLPRYFPYQFGPQIIPSTKDTHLIES